MFLFTNPNCLSFPNSSLSRMAYARATREWGRLWRSVIFSDEKLFTSSVVGRIRVKRARGERDLEEMTVRQANFTDVRVNVWGMVSYDGGARVFLAGPKFKAAKYIRCLQRNLLTAGFDFARLVFCQDNVRFHTTDGVRSFFRTNNIRCLKHPPQSPDLNPQEQVWDFIQRRLTEHLRTNFVNNPTELLELIQRFAEEIPVESINRLFDSMPKKVDAVIRNFGKATKY